MPSTRPADPEEVGTINLSPKVPTLNGTHLNRLIDIYVESCRARLDHQVTVDGYEYQLIWFKEWWEAQGPGQAWLLRPDDFMHFEKYLLTAISPSTKRRLSYHTRHTVVKRLREMFGWALAKGYLDRDYAKWVPPAAGGPPKRKAANLEALHKLLDAAGDLEEKARLRNRAIVAMLMGMGLRRAELSHLDIDEVIIHADHSGSASVVGKRTQANPTGERETAFDSATGKIIVAYLDEEDRRSGPLFRGKGGKRLTGQGIYIMVKKAIAAAQLEKQIVGPHDLRRAFATHYRRSRGGKASAHLLQLQLGHASPEQTNEYALMEVDDIRVDMVSPLSLFEENDPY